MVAVNLHGIHSFNTTLTANDTTAKETLGVLRWEDNGKAYRYVQNSSGSIDGVQGDCYVLESIGAWIATQDISEGASADGQTAVGVGVGTFSVGNFGWLQVWGQGNVNTNGDNDITTGGLLFVSADGDANHTAAGTAVVRWPIGVALADDGTATVSAFIRCLN